MRVLVLGGYGFIGGEIVRVLLARGFEVIGLGRDADLGRRLYPGAAWIGADIAALRTPDAWAGYLGGVDAVVNAAGALQDGGRDNLAAVHDIAIRACIGAAQNSGVKTFVQISAPGASKSGSTAFLRTKAGADACLRESALDWVILKPGLVIGRNAHGGTALLRMLAAFPLVQPMIRASGGVQTVAIDDVTDAIIAALAGEVPLRAEYDLVEDEAHSLADIVRSMRAWLGFRKAAFDIVAPLWLAGVLSFAADIAGNLGWRSALRSTALKMMAEGVRGDPEPWRQARGRSMKSLAASLAAAPSIVQERIYARVQLLLPLIVLSLSAFWTISGLVALLNVGAAAKALQPEMSPGLAAAAVIVAAILDIAIGAALLLRRTARGAAFAAAGIAAIYVAAATHFAPALWLDPFGPYVKVLPAIVLSLALGLLLQER
jgi:uncharacterized protein YbjT (DUF2867 family)